MRSSGAVLASAMLVALVASTVGVQAEPLAGPATAPAQEAGEPGPAGPGAAAERADATRSAVPAGWAQMVERTWRAPAASPEARAQRTREALAYHGVDALEPAARALLLDRTAGTPADRAEAATSLAPDLPAAWSALAQARLEQHDLRGGAVALARALAALPVHLEARDWLESTVLEVGLQGLAWGSALYLLVAGLGGVRRASHDLGDLLFRAAPLEADPAPAFARVALVLALLLLPAVLGEGFLGLAPGLLLLAVLHGTGSGRVAAGVAALCLTLALHPLADRVMQRFAALGAETVAPAAYAQSRGGSRWLDRLRVERAAGTDPLALEVLALEARRNGRLDEARARFEELLERSQEPRVLNNAANVLLLRGELDAATALYERAAGGADSAVVLYNLAQAYGRSIRFEDHERALSRAQSLDEDVVETLLARQSDGGPPVADLPIPAEEVRARRAGNEAAVLPAHPLSTALAPGRLGADPRLAFPALAAALGLGLVLRGRYRPSRACDRCGARLCPRCDPKPAADGQCEACLRLTQRPETTDPDLRAERLAALRRRQGWRTRLRLALSLGVPGAAGLLDDAPLRGLLACLCLAGAAALALERRGTLPDPVAVGGVGPLLFGGLAALLALAYAVLLARSLGARGGA